MSAYTFSSGLALLELCHTHRLSICAVMQKRESAEFGRSEEDVRSEMKRVWRIMGDAVQSGLERAHNSVGGLVGGEAQKLMAMTSPLLGDPARRAAAMAMATAEVNASMGRIVAAPTAGSCGVLPGVLCAEEYEQERIIDALFTASAVGMLIQMNASVSGAQGGCQAEVGTASAMAAAALCELRGGSPAMALHAAATALQNLMGLVCDPVAGLVEVPCVKRNAIGAINALLCADMALCGITSPIPFDETVGAMYAVGCAMPQSLRESATGGLAATPTARALEQSIFGTEQTIPDDLGR
jgi:L-serine dehydratase